MKSLEAIPHYQLDQDGDILVGSHFNHVQMQEVKQQVGKLYNKHVEHYEWPEREIMVAAGRRVLS